MSIFSENIRVLRDRKGLSQQQIADELIITRERYASYESGRSEPPIEVLLRISKFFHISIDLLVSVEIRKYPIDDILQLPDNRLVLPVVVDQEGNNSIEIVPQKASMGYLEGYTDPGYIESLQRMSLPFLRNGKYRAFPASGDSMPPFIDGSYIIGKYVEKMEDLKPGKTYVFVTQHEGIAMKTLVSRNEKSLTVSADNTFYDPYDIPSADIVEIWQYAWGLLPEGYKAGSGAMSVNEMFWELKKEIKKLKALIQS